MPSPTFVWFGSALLDSDYFLRTIGEAPRVELLVIAR